MKKLEHFFKTHPESTEVHQTSDGLLFFLKDNAIAHTVVMARENKNFSVAVKTFTRDQVVKPNDADNSKAEKEANEKEESDKKEAKEKEAADKKAEKEKAEADKKAAKEQEEADKKTAKEKADADKKNQNPK